MQTYSQTFTSATTWELNVSGKYFATLECTLPVNVRFYKGGKLLELGEIKGLLGGLEVTLGDIADREAAFDRVQIDVQTGDTVKVGIGNGQARYNRGQASVNVITGRAPQSGAFVNTQRTVTNASAQLLAANANRQYLLIQNKDAQGDIYVTFGAAATAGNGIRIEAGGNFTMEGTQSTQAVYAVGTVANNANVLTVEG